MKLDRDISGSWFSTESYSERIDQSSEPDWHRLGSYGPGPTTGDGGGRRADGDRSGIGCEGLRFTVVAMAVAVAVTVAG